MGERGERGRDEAQFHGGWLHTEVGRQVRPVVRARWRDRLRRALRALRRRAAPPPRNPR